MRVDINCDMGESYGAYQIGADAEVMPYITSANIACGFHGGDPAVMRATVTAAIKANVAIGAHPGLPDLVGFGRRTMQISPEEAYDMVVYQVGALLGFVRAAGAELRHVKPHGALYNMAARDRRLSDAIARAVASFDASLVLFGLAGSVMLDAGRDAGLQVAAEGFADRTYEPDGSLTPRSRPGAVVHDSAEVARRAMRMVRDGAVITSAGSVLPLQIDTICVHGDTPGADVSARALRQALVDSGIDVRAVGAQS